MFSCHICHVRIEGGDSVIPALPFDMSGRSSFVNCDVCLPQPSLFANESSCARGRTRAVHHQFEKCFSEFGCIFSVFSVCSSRGVFNLRQKQIKDNFDKRIICVFVISMKNVAWLRKYLLSDDLLDVVE